MFTSSMCILVNDVISNKFNEVCFIIQSKLNAKTHFFMTVKIWFDNSTRLFKYCSMIVMQLSSAKRTAVGTVFWIYLLNS